MFTTLILSSPGLLLPTRVLYLPIGEREIEAGSMEGAGYSGKVVVDFDGFSAIRRSFDEMKAASERVWIDAGHEEKEAMGDITGFSFDPQNGIYADVSWTPAGERALREKSFVALSPAFAVNQFSGRVAGLLRGHAAAGLVNNPAFGRATTLIAARQGDGAPETDDDRIARQFSDNHVEMFNA